MNRKKKFKKKCFTINLKNIYIYKEREREREREREFTFYTQ